MPSVLVQCWSNIRKVIWPEKILKKVLIVVSMLIFCACWNCMMFVSLVVSGNWKQTMFHTCWNETVSYYRAVTVSSASSQLCLCVCRYWYPLTHFLSLAFTPTTLIGLNISLDMPKVEFRSNARPSMYAYPPALEEKKDKNKEKVETAILSTTARQKKKEAEKKKDEKMEVVSEQLRCFIDSYKMEVVSEQLRYFIHSYKCRRMKFLLHVCLSASGIYGDEEALHQVYLYLFHFVREW